MLATDPENTKEARRISNALYPALTDLELAVKNAAVSRGAEGPMAERDQRLENS
jgi:hypothetical protein